MESEGSHHVSSGPLSLTCNPLPPGMSLGCTYRLPAVGFGLQLFLEFLPGDLSLLVPEQ
jgi:hypothetical protein